MAKEYIPNYHVEWADVYNSFCVLLDLEDLRWEETAKSFVEHMEDLISWEIMRKELLTEKPKVECPSLTEFDLHVVEAMSIVNDLPFIPQLPTKKPKSENWYHYLQMLWAIFMYAWHGLKGIDIPVAIEREN